MSGEFNEIEVNKQNILQDKTSQAQKINKKKPLVFLIIAAVILVAIFFFGIFLPAQTVLLSLNGVKTSAKEAYEAAKQQNLAKTSEKLKLTRSKLSDTQNKLKVLTWVKFIPLISSYYQDADHFVKAGFYVLDAADLVVESLTPYADLLGLKGEKSFVGGTAEERIQKAVETMDKVTPNLGKIAQNLSLVRKEIDKIEPRKYPKSLGKTQIRVQIERVKELVDETDQVLTDARPLLEVLPSLLGQPKEQKYLLLFQNDKELRSTGGFITAYAILRLDKGKIYVESSDDIYRLDDAKTKRVSAPTPILKYLPLVPYWHLRDSNISPDFYVSMQNFSELYKSVPGQPKLSGIVAIDTQVLVKVMDVLGAISVYGTEFTTKIVPECNCPQVVYELELYADKPVGYAKGARKDIIGALMSAIMHKALSSSPKLYWGPLFQTGIEALSEKHVLIYLTDERAQKSVEALNFAGRLREYDGDYLHINDTNFAGAKSNMYVREFVEQKFEVDSNGTITKTLTINYKNPQSPSDCNLERGGLCLNGLLRNWIRIYVPKGSQLAESKGSEVKMTTGEDLGKTVFEGFLTVRPLGSAQLTVKYQLPFKYDKKGLSLLIQKQPGTEGHEYTIIVSGKEREKFNLKIDRELPLKI